MISPHVFGHETAKGAPRMLAVDFIHQGIKCFGKYSAIPPLRCPKEIAAQVKQGAQEIFALEVERAEFTVLLQGVERTDVGVAAGDDGQHGKARPGAAG